MAGVIGGTVIGLAVANGSADEQPPSTETTETTVVQVQVTETLPPTTVAAPVVSIEAPTPSAPIVEPVTTTPEAVAPQPVQPFVASTPEAPAPQVTQGEGIVEGPSTSFDAPRAPQAEPLPGTTEGVNDSDNHPVG